MRILLRWSISALLCAASLAHAQNASEQLITEIGAHAELMSNLEQLCDDIGPRMTGTPQLRSAQAWAMDRLRRYGAVDVHEEAYDMGRPWTRGTASARLLNANRMALDIVQKAWTLGTHGTVTGQVAILDVNTLDELRSAAPKLAGKIVLVVASPRASADQRQHMARYLADVNAIIDQAKFAGVLLVSGKEHNLQDMWGGPESRFQHNASIISADSAALLKRLIARGVVPQLALRLTGDFGSKPVKAYNVVADFKGSEPGEIVIVGAHLDSWDLASGATDNASGAVGAMEILRAMHALNLKPKRSLRVVLFSGEEQGLLGSKAYLAAHKDELAQIQAVLVQDAGAGRILGFPDMKVEAWYGALKEAIAPAKALGAQDIIYEIGRGSDHDSFFARGIPAFTPMQDPLDYPTQTQHSQIDTPGHVAGASLLQATQVMAVMAWGLMNGDRLPHQAAP
ncbi:MAG: M20/M25/M40 family metallo-hydrolase [Massilia sp.]